ncbi:SAVED domain-containing protein [Micromonospora sp. NPDC047467]|uniref:SAVED domain-containing protein n=1 Tax=Micromonospora sp. NPDC047467 TaxID=3154814 RepID=UPI0033E6EBEA
MASKQVRNTSVKRGDIKDTVRLAVWARAAGCCVMCSTTLLGSRSYLHSVLVGELAHNVGATATPGSPRGLVEDIADREAEENLLLLCHACHRLIDNEDHAPYFTTERLQTLKKEHEGRIRVVATSGGMRRTAALRVGGLVRGATALASQRQTADALLADGYLGLVDSRWQGDFLCKIAGDPNRSTYWLAAQEEIDATLGLIEQSIASGEVEHLSIFAIAPIPLLVYLGSRLDDKTDTRLYQKQRDGDQGWRWDATASIHDFSTRATVGATPAMEVVLAASLTAEIQQASLPDTLEGLPYFEIRPDVDRFGPSLFSHSDTLRNFADRWRTLLAEVEKTCPRATKWHLVAAAPLTPAIEMGRAFMRGAQPPTVVYDRQNGTYTPVVQVNT